MAGPDIRTANQVMRQWDKLEQIKRGLVKQGLLNGDATPAMVIAKIRELVPAELFEAA